MKVSKIALVFAALTINGTVPVNPGNARQVKALERRGWVKINPEAKQAEFLG